MQRRLEFGAFKFEPPRVACYKRFVNRRKFIQATAIAATATATNFSMTQAAEKSKGVDWPIGCFNRPWMRSPKLNLDYDAALDGIKAAG